MTSKQMRDVVIWLREHAIDRQITTTLHDGMTQVADQLDKHVELHDELESQAKKFFIQAQELKLERDKLLNEIERLKR